MTLASDADRRFADEEYFRRAYWGMRIYLVLIKQANEQMNQALALECGLRYAYWQERAIAFASR